MIPVAGIEWACDPHESHRPSMPVDVPADAQFFVTVTNVEPVFPEGSYALTWIDAVVDVEVVVVLPLLIVLVVVPPVLHA